MDIGTAKPKLSEIYRYNYHLINFLYPQDFITAVDYAKKATEKIKNSIKKNKIPFLVGGTGLYIKAIFEPFSPLPSRSEKIRENLEKISSSELYNELKKIDKERALKLNINDKQRIIRALEIYYTTGKTFTELTQNPIKSELSPVYIGLTMERDKLYEAIEKRFLKMLKEGFIEEVEFLIKIGYGPWNHAFNAHGYMEIYSYLKGEITYKEMIHRAIVNLKHYSRKQLIWFNKLKDVVWINSKNADTGYVLKLLANVLHERGVL